MGKAGGNTMFRIFENNEVVFETDSISKLIEYIERQEEYNPKYIEFYAPDSRL
jgi:hypothetical protein